MTSSLFKTNPIDQKHPRAPSSDDRNDVVTVYDHAGNPHQHTNTNARQLIRLSGWTRDAKEAERRHANPLEPIRHVNLEHGREGVTSRHLQPRTSSQVINGVQQFEITASAGSNHVAAPAA